ncbi:hypothetical protein HMPREF1544_08902 [Mucor circinelloides 1006PhL]|uniref:Uncharacterized protein n=1 Tax=Mucor circinelloides f. circinelloides (strain 1006PhL) TaxID=1220926 RepID=S2J7L5_MUCC1|nr:hypothetical protein HMPREF1544_08902 [Mucor circinelloides 1006PhL]
MATTATSNCVLYPIDSINNTQKQQQPEQADATMVQFLTPSSSPLPEQKSNSHVVQLPPTPTASDDEIDAEEEQKLLHEKSIKLQRRGTVSLADLIPVASAALRAKHRQSMMAAQPTQDSALARALTKVKIGVQTHRLKERYLLNEWIRLALAAPVDESTINNAKRVLRTNRTMEIVRWYEHKFKRATLSLDELEKRVDCLRQQKLLVQQQQQELEQSMTSISSISSLPSPPATHLNFSKVASA